MAQCIDHDWLVLRPPSSSCCIRQPSRCPSLCIRPVFGPRISLTACRRDSRSKSVTCLLNAAPSAGVRGMSATVIPMRHQKHVAKYVSPFQWIKFLFQSNKVVCQVFSSWTSSYITYVLQLWHFHSNPSGNKLCRRVLQRDPAAGCGS